MNELFEFSTDDLQCNVEQITKEDFIKKDKHLLEKLINGHSKYFKKVFNEDEVEEQESCTACNGFIYREQGGDIVECTACDGTGLKSDTQFDSDGFAEFFQEEMLLGEDSLLDLIYCEPKD